MILQILLPENQDRTIDLWWKKKNPRNSCLKESILIKGPLKEILKIDAGAKQVPGYKSLCQRKEHINLHSTLSLFAFPPSQAPLNNEWKLSKCIYNVPHHAPLQLTWQFSDEGMIWAGLCSCFRWLIYRAVLILIFEEIRCSALLAKMSCWRD